MNAFETMSLVYSDLTQEIFSSSTCRSRIVSTGLIPSVHLHSVCDRNVVTMSTFGETKRLGFVMQRYHPFLGFELPLLMFHEKAPCLCSCPCPLFSNINERKEENSLMTFDANGASATPNSALCCIQPPALCTLGHEK